jgi:hypothetical protein
MRPADHPLPRIRPARRLSVAHNFSFGFFPVEALKEGQPEKMIHEIPDNSTTKYQDDVLQITRLVKYAKNSFS